MRGKKSRANELRPAFEKYSKIGEKSNATVEGRAKIEDIAQYLGLSVSTIRIYVKEQAKKGDTLRIKNGEVYDTQDTTADKRSARPLHHKVKISRQRELKKKQGGKQ